MTSVFADSYQVLARWQGGNTSIGYSIGTTFPATGFVCLSTNNYCEAHGLQNLICLKKKQQIVRDIRKREGRPSRLVGNILTLFPNRL